MSGESRAVRTDRAGRGLVIGIALVLAGVLCLGRLVQWQLMPHDFALGSRRVVPGASSSQPLMSRLPKRCVPRRPRGSSLGSHCAKCERDSIRNLAAPLRQASRVTSLDSSMALELANTE